MSEFHPPPPPPKPRRHSFQLPPTNFFLPIRAKLAELEAPAKFKSDLEVPMAFIIAFALGSILGIAFPLAVNSAFSSALGPGASWITSVFIAPFFTEEISKAVCMLIVAFALVRVFPNRRYGAAIGAATGLGFAIMENVVYAVQGQTDAVSGLMRLINTPVTHPLFSAFVGMGVFALMARMRRGNTFFGALAGIPIILVLVGMMNHCLWNALTFLPVWPSRIIRLFLLSPIFIVILRDLLGGHFNFTRFFEQHPEPARFNSRQPPPPPPPP